MPFTLTEDSQFYGLEVSLSNILMIGLFRSNFRSSNRMLIFSKTKQYHRKHVRDRTFITFRWKGGWGGS